MSVLWLLSGILTLAAAGYFICRARAVSSADGDQRGLHSLPVYYGGVSVIFTVIPALFITACWLIVQPVVVTQWTAELIPAAVVPLSSNLSLIMSDVSRLASGLDLAVRQGALSEPEVVALAAGSGDIRAMLAGMGTALGAHVGPEVLFAAQTYRTLTVVGSDLMALIVGLFALGGFATSVALSHKDVRARHTVETAVLGLLILSAFIAILSTVGIVLSMVFETANFFQLHAWKDFFFGLVWAPHFRFESQLSILPLLWGTLYISFVALLVAVPVGLFAAIYLSEYAGRRTRGFAKPLLEVLAGIPTIVYGLFALVTFGPFLQKLFGTDGLLGVNWMGDARSVATAGVVMGVMLIPFVSSLSDDIISAVPQTLRDGSYGLGATKSETIRQVILPAALPGIVGAILLAGSRAIGETMIVVLGAGAIARFTGNPLEALTTITTRIVSQLTGDGDFNSPETYVAFALGLSLFVFTLALNIAALYVVRRYREQYE